ncbi:MAG: DNA translocase FtsK 4TM domain-containing protein, partial [Clostridia bacterium]|nr:DNA translocase FtsK 4TM domain-containing protein [Clostridia bacterium]
MNQESRKQPTDGTKAPASAPSVENLLDDFGGRSSSPTPEPTPSKKASAPSESASLSKKAEIRKASAERKEEQAPAAKKESASRVKAKASSEKKTDKKQTVRASTGREKKASPQNAKKEASSKAASSAQPPRSAKPAHQIIPYVLIILAVFIGVSLVLNIFCNPNNKLESNPSAHWMGVVGYSLCYGLFGVLGMAVLVLPFLLLNLSFYWKKYIDNRLTISKIVASLLFPICLAALIHVFALIALEDGSRALSASELFFYGAKMQGGGLIGGGLGYFLYSYLSWTGSIILLITLLAASLFFCLGMTPQYLWSRYRMRRAERRARKQQSLSAQNAEDAKSKAELAEKLRRKTAGTQMSINDPSADGSPDGAVEIVGAALRKSDKLAPIPMPLLDPTDGTRPFVPTDVSRKLAEDPSPAPTTPSASPVSTAQKATAEAAPKQASAPAPQSAAPAPAASAINPAKNRDAAIDPIFPKSTDAKQVRKIPRTERDFDLKNVFIDLEDRPSTAPKKHAALPPEAPLPGSTVRKATPQNAPSTRPAAPTAARPASPTAARPMPGSAPAARPSTLATPQSSVRAQAQPITAARPAPLSALAGKNTPKAAANAQKPMAHRLDTTADQKFGLSDEEFEKLEASRTVPTRPGTQKPSAGSTKTATSPARAAAKPAAPQALVKTKKYVFPPESYLHEAVPMSAENEAEIAETVTQLQETLQNFHVSIKDIQYACGPTATRYEVFPAPGVRVRSFLNLSDDIALALAAGGIRMEAPIPGKSAVGIEVPNKNRATVFLRELIESKAFKTASSKLTACLGADIAGKPLLFDISKMPHLLVAGTTGSGKSVCINCTIISILYKAK